MEENAFRENDLPDRLLELLLHRLGAADPAAACESVRTELRERLRLLFEVLPAAERLAEICGPGNRSAACSRTQEDFSATPGTTGLPNEKNGSGAAARDACPTDRTAGSRSGQHGRTATCRGENASAPPRPEDTADEDRGGNGCDTGPFEKLIEEFLTRLTTASDRECSIPPAANPRQPYRHGDRSTEPAEREASPSAASSTGSGSDYHSLEKLAEELLVRLAGKADKNASVSPARDAATDSHPGNKAANTFQPGGGSTEHVPVEEQAGPVAAEKFTALFLARLAAAANGDRAYTVKDGPTCRGGKRAVESTEAEDIPAREAPGLSAFEILAERLLARLAEATRQDTFSLSANAPAGTCRAKNGPTELSGKGSPDTETPAAAAGPTHAIRAESGTVKTCGDTTSSGTTAGSTDTFRAEKVPGGMCDTGDSPLSLAKLAERLLARLAEAAEGAAPATSPDNTDKDPGPAACATETGNTYHSPVSPPLDKLAQWLLARLMERTDASAAPSPGDGNAAGFPPENDRCETGSTEPATLFRTETDAVQSRCAEGAPAEMHHPENHPAASFHPAGTPDRGQDMAELTALLDRFLLLQTLKNRMQ